MGGRVGVGGPPPPRSAMVGGMAGWWKVLADGNRVGRVAVKFGKRLILMRKKKANSGVLSLLFFFQFLLSAKTSSFSLSWSQSSL